MAPDIRLIAVDLDGTLLNPENKVSDEDLRAVREAMDAGVQVVLATSRWHQAARRTALTLGVEGFIISHNGALVRTCDGSGELVHHRIGMDLALEIARHIDAAGGNAYLTVADQTFIRASPGRAPSRLAPDMTVCEELAEVVTAEPTAFLLFGKEAVASTVGRFRQHHGTELNLAQGFSRLFPDYLNIVHARADKGAGLRAVCEELGVPLTATLAIGDAAPDIAMIKIAGLGVAMGNAAEAVKDAADDVAPSNAESGVAWAIRRFILGRA